MPQVSRRDLPGVVAKGADGATTVACTMRLAHRGGVRVFVTGGIGGVHRGGEATLDVSADLTELGRTPVCVVCAGAKSILDIPRTLEYLETQVRPPSREAAAAASRRGSAPRSPPRSTFRGAVLTLSPDAGGAGGGVRGHTLPVAADTADTRTPTRPRSAATGRTSFPPSTRRRPGAGRPAEWTRRRRRRPWWPAACGSGCKAAACWPSPSRPTRWGRPNPTTPFLWDSFADRLPPQAPAGRSIERAIDRAVAEAEEKGITGNQISPFLLARIAELTGGASLRSNIALVKHNARVGSLVAVHLSRAAPDLAPG